MSQTLELPDEVFDALKKVASERGLTPVQWVMKTLPTQSSNNERPLSEALEGLTGVIDSRAEPRPQYVSSAFGAGLVKKFEKQGLKRP